MLYVRIFIESKATGGDRQREVWLDHPPVEGRVIPLPDETIVVDDVTKTPDADVDYVVVGHPA